MRFRWLLLWSLVAVLGLAPTPACTTRENVLHPTFPGGGMLAKATAVPVDSLAQLRAIFEIPEGTHVLGRTPIVVQTTDRQVSLFAQSNTAYAILDAGCVDAGTHLVLEGAWRYANAANTGLIRLFVEPPDVAHSLCSGAKLTDSSIKSIVLRGVIGSGEAEPDEDFSSMWKAPLGDTKGFIVAAHHGACRTIDDCGASENSRESIRMVEAFGANVVELDVRLTRDGIPILFHDDTFSARLARGELCHGQVGDFTLAAMRAACTLEYGEEVPTLAEALDTTIRDTHLSGVWLDIKEPVAVAPTLAVVADQKRRAIERKRDIAIVVGLGESEIVDAYRQADKPPGTECLCELESADVASIPCAFWGPRWTRGPMNDEVAAVQSAGRRVVYWTINEPEFVTLFLKAHPDGILTDRPGLLVNRVQLMLLSGERVGRP